MLLLCRNSFSVSFRLSRCYASSSKYLDGSSSIQHSQRCKSLSEIPGPKSIPFVGSVPSFVKYGGSKKFHLYMEGMVQEFGKIFAVTFGSEYVVGIADPESVEKLFRSEGKYPNREPPIPAWTAYHKQRNIPNGLFQMYGKDWHRHRLAHNPLLMKPKKVGSYVPVLNEVSNDLMETICGKRDDNCAVADLQSDLFRWSLEGICSVVYGQKLTELDLAAADVQDFVDLNAQLIDVVIKLFLYGPVLDNPYSPVRKQIFSILDQLYDFHSKHVQAVLKDYECKSGSPDISMEKDVAGFIPYLYHKQDFSIGDMLADVMSFTLAGIETTSASMLWYLLTLSKNQDKQSLLHEEIVNVTGGSDVITAKMIDDMKFLSATRKEVLRLHQTVPGTIRFLEEDITLHGYRIPRQTMIFAVVSAMGKNSELVSDPQNFLPERWLRGHALEEAIHPFAFLPFGYGQRMCIGMRVAVAEMSILIAKIFKKYRVESDLDEPLTGTLSAAVAPEKPIKFRFIER